MSTNFDRRGLLKLALAGAAVSALPSCHKVEFGKHSFINYPFSLGVASGDPLPDGVVLWTRLAPNPLEDVGLSGIFSVAWEVSEEDAFRKIVQSGVTLAHPELAHSVHVELNGLRSNRDYYYRFIVDGIVSPIGRTRTAPLIGAKLDSFRFAVACCQSYSHGYYGAYKDLAKAYPDLVLHLGDYIYESPWTMPVRRMPASEAISLSEYRAYHAVTKLDPHLQAAHAVAPWLAIWDDHEVVNDYRADHPPQGYSKEQFAVRRRAAYQAYYEHMPIRRRAQPVNGAVQLYQRSIFGDLLQFDLLDTRQYRSDHPCRDEDGAADSWIDCDASNPARTMLGSDQEKWLRRGLGVANSRWSMIVQTTQMTPYIRRVDGNLKYSSDRWDAYPAARERLFNLIKEKNLRNPVVLGGDVHAFFGTGLKGGEHENVLATELVCGAISSGGGGDERYKDETSFYNARNEPYYFENRGNGYLLCTVTHQSITAQIRQVDTVLDPASFSHTLKTLTIEDAAFGVNT